MIELAYRKKITILGAVLAALVVLYVLGVLFSPTRVQQRSASTPLYPDLKAEAVQEIQIQEPGGAGGAAASLTMKRQGDGWQLLIQGTAFPALASRIDTLLEQLAGLKRARVASTDPQTWPAFEVDKEKARRLVLKDAAGKALVDLHVGKPAPGGQGSYVRREGSNDVVQADRSLDYYAGASDEQWSDLRLFPRELQGGDLVRIDVRGRTGFDAEEKESGRPVSHSLLLESGQEGPRWQVQGDPDFALAADKVEGLAATLAGFEGSRFAVNVPEGQAGFDSPFGEIGVSTRDDKSYRLLIGAYLQAEEQYYARLEGGPFTWLVPAWRVRQAFQTLETLKAAPQP